VLAVLLMLVCIAASGCAAQRANPTNTAQAAMGPDSPRGTASPIDAFALPEHIDPKAGYLFYLHGRIVEEQGLAAVDPILGAYEYEAILNRLAASGMTVISEQREKDANAEAYAARLQEQIETLKAAGVPSGRITVVGASKGGYIAAVASFLLRDPELRFVLLGTCDAGMVREWRARDRWLYGNVLAIRDEADTEFAGPCEGMFELSEGKGLGRHEEMVLHLGTGHGILYHPVEEWVLPTLAWANP